jgi:hypothetical protein
MSTQQFVEASENRAPWLRGYFELQGVDTPNRALSDTCFGFSVGRGRPAWSSYGFLTRPLVPTSPARGSRPAPRQAVFGDRVCDRLGAQHDTSFEMIRNARSRRIPILTDNGSGTSSDHGKWHGIVPGPDWHETDGGHPFQCRRQQGYCRPAGGVGVIVPGKLADIVKIGSAVSKIG